MKRMMEQEFALSRVMMDKLGEKLNKICSYTIICLEVSIYVDIDFYDRSGYICDLKWTLKQKDEKDHKDYLKSTFNLKCWTFISMVVMFVPSSWHFVCFALCLQMSTFMEIKEMRVFNLLVSFVSSQVYHCYRLFFMINCEVLRLISSMDFVVVGNWKSSNYEKWKFAWANGFYLF